MQYHADDSLNSLCNHYARWSLLLEHRLQHPHKFHCHNHVFYLNQIHQAVLKLWKINEKDNCPEVKIRISIRTFSRLFAKIVSLVWKKNTKLTISFEISSKHHRQHNGQLNGILNKNFRAWKLASEYTWNL